MIPKTLNGWITVAIGLALAVMVAYTGQLAAKGVPTPMWAVLVNAALAYLGLTLRGGGVELKKPGPGLTLLTLLAVLMLSACNPWAAAMKTTGTLMYATKTTSKTLAAADTVKHDACLKAHGAKTEAYKACMADVVKRLEAYRETARPIARSSVAAGLIGIRVAREAKKKNVNYLEILRPGGCGLILWLRAWGHKLPDKGAAILPLLESFSGMMCDKAATHTPKSAVAVLTAILPAAVDFVKWIVKLVGASTDELEKEISDWLQGPTTDEVDVLWGKIQAAMPGGV